MKPRSLSGFSLGAGSELAKEQTAKSAYRQATRAAAKSSRISGRQIGGDTRRGADLLTASPEQLQAEAEAIMQERFEKVTDEIKKIGAMKGDLAHKKASMIFDLSGNKAERRALRKHFEGKESGTNLQSAGDAISVSRETLLEWMSEGNTVTIVNDGTIQF